MPSSPIYPVWDIHSISQGYNFKKRYWTNPWVVKQVYIGYIGEDGILLKYTRYITWYISCIYLSVSDIPDIYQEYLWYILYGLSFVYTCIYQVYTEYMLSIYIVYTWYVYSIFLGYTMYIFGIYSIYTLYNMRMYSTGGWCCGGGQGPIPLAPPAITSESPRRVITFILLEQGIKCSTRNIPGIYQEYCRYIPNAGPWTSCWIRLQGWPRGYL